jgi:hypothetical protein
VGAVVEDEPTLAEVVEVEAHARVLEHPAEEGVVGLAVLDPVRARSSHPHYAGSYERGTFSRAVALARFG